MASSTSWGCTGSLGGCARQGGCHGDGVGGGFHFETHAGVIAGGADEQVLIGGGVEIAGVGIQLGHGALQGTGQQAVFADGLHVVPLHPIQHFTEQRAAAAVMGWQAAHHAQGLQCSEAPHSQQEADGHACHEQEQASDTNKVFEHPSPRISANLA
jgi:hypothetical protein